MYIRIRENNETFRAFNAIRLQKGYITFTSAILEAMKTVVVKGFVGDVRKPKENETTTITE